MIKIKKIMKVKELMKFGILLALLGCSSQTMAFRCSVNGGPDNDQGTADLRLNLIPSIGSSYNIIVDLSQYVQCYNENGVDGDPTDYFLVEARSSVDILSGYTALLKLGSNPLINFPLANDSLPYGFVASNGRPRVPVPLSILFSPVGAAGGQNITNGQRIATLYMRKYYERPGRDEMRFTWNIFAANDVLIPTGGCNVSDRDVSVSLPPYDATSNQPFPVQLTVNCPSGDKRLEYTLSGTTDSSQTIFTNMAPLVPTPAQGIGIQMLDSNNNVITAGRPVSLGIVGPSSVDLKLKARYAQTVGQVTAGPVKSIIAVVFSYP